MQKRHAIKMLSYRRIRQFLNNNSTAAVSAKVMTDSKNGFDSHLNRIEGILVPDAKTTKPTTAYKNEVLEGLANGLVPVMNDVLLYTNNTALSGQIPPPCWRTTRSAVSCGSAPCWMPASRCPSPTWKIMGWKPPS